MIQILLVERKHLSKREEKQVSLHVLKNQNVQQSPASNVHFQSPGREAGLACMQWCVDTVESNTLAIRHMSQLGFQIVNLVKNRVLSYEHRKKLQ
jgi:hypothetical protein